MRYRTPDWNPPGMVFTSTPLMSINSWGTRADWRARISKAAWGIVVPWSVPTKTPYRESIQLPTGTSCVSQCAWSCIVRLISSARSKLSLSPNAQTTATAPCSSLSTSASDSACPLVSRRGSICRRNCNRAMASSWACLLSRCAFSSLAEARSLAAPADCSASPACCRTSATNRPLLFLRSALTSPTVIPTHSSPATPTATMTAANSWNAKNQGLGFSGDLIVALRQAFRSSLYSRTIAMTSRATPTTTMKVQMVSQNSNDTACDAAPDICFSTVEIALSKAEVAIAPLRHTQRLCAVRIARAKSGLPASPGYSIL